VGQAGPMLLKKSRLSAPSIFRRARTCKEMIVRELDPSVLKPPLANGHDISVDPNLPVGPSSWAALTNRSCCPLQGQRHSVV